MAKLTDLKMKMVVTLLSVATMVQTLGESKQTPAVRHLIDRASEAQLLDVLTEEESGTVRIPMVQLIEEHEAAFQKFSESADEWEKAVEKMKQNLSRIASNQSDLKETTGQTIHSGRVLQMLAEILTTTSQKNKEKQIEERKLLDQKLSNALEKYQAGRDERALAYKKHREAYQVKRKGLVKKYGKAWVEALEKDAAVWYQGVVQQHTLQKLNVDNR
jgi:predicted  nucleic acid-binding Zn-ribbon protein